MIQKLLFASALAFTCQFTNAQFALGDIAFSAYSAETAANLPPGAPVDAFTFVILRDVLPGEDITFDENGWFTLLGGLRAGESACTLTFGTAYPAGTQIVVSAVPFEARDQDGTIAGDLTGSPLGLATGGDSVFAYNAGSVPTLGDQSSFIAALNMTGAWMPDGSSATGSTTSTEKPSVFTEGVNVVSIEPEVDNARILLAKCSSFSDIPTLRAMLNLAANWETDNLFGYDQSTPLCNFVNTLSIGDQIINSQNLQLVPNPVNNVFSVKTPNGFTLSSLEIISMTGKQVLVKNQFSEDNNIDVSALNAGIYMVRMIANDNIIIKKLVKN